MNNFIPVPLHEVYDDWVEEHRAKGIIRPDFPEAEWFTAEVEQQDIDALFLLPCAEFRILSKQSWRLRPATAYYDQHYQAGAYDPEHVDRMERLLGWSGRLESKIRMISASRSGPFTMLDGNHRAILLMSERRLVGSSVYVGIHPALRRYCWMQHAYNNWPVDAST